MKKLCIILTALCLMLITVSFACAASLPSVSFAQKSGSINGGMPYTLTVSMKKALPEDLSVEILNNATDEVLTILIPAGEKKASAEIATGVVDQQEKVVYSFVESDAYKGGSSHTLTIAKLPQVKFYLDVYMGKVGKDLTVRVHADTPSRVVKGSVYQLRDKDGAVLAEKEWKNGKNDLYFKFRVTEEMIGRHDLSVWLGDYEVSTETGYCAVYKPDAKAVISTEPELPLMSIGMDCMYIADLTDEVLAVLEEHDVKITFFMAGHFMRKYPEEAKKILDAGHEIAQHTNTHDDLAKLDPMDILEELHTPIQLAEETLGVTPRLIRPPYGHYTSNATSIAHAEGMEIVRWSSSFGDSSETISETKIMRNATTGANYQPGSIALCHLDGKCMTESLDAALDLIEELGLKVVPISALLYASGRELPAEPDGVMVYTNDYWATWLEREMPEMLAE